MGHIFERMVTSIKKRSILVFLFTTMICCLIFGSYLSKKPPKEFGDLRPMLKVEDVLYLDTGKEIPIEVGDSEIIGKVISSVAPSLKPTENGHTNFGSIGSKYAYYEENVVVLLNNEWVLFERE